MCRWCLTQEAPACASPWCLDNPLRSHLARLVRQTQWHARSRQLEQLTQREQPRHQAVRTAILLPLGTVGTRLLYLGRLVTLKQGQL